MIQVIPEMLPKDLDAILKCIPEQPTQVQVQLFGEFNYSSIVKQAEKVLPGVDLSKQNGGHTYTLDKPTNKLISTVYRKSRWAMALQDRLLKVINEAGDSASAKDKKGRQKMMNAKRIHFREASWYVGFDPTSCDHSTDVHIKLTPWEVEVKYQGKEPKYVSDIRKAVADNVRFVAYANQ